MLFVKDRRTKKIFRVTHYTENGVDGYDVVCENWPGIHSIGKDCELVCIKTDKQAKAIDHILKNPDHTLLEIAGDLRIDPSYAHKIIKKYNLIHKTAHSHGSI